MAPSTRKIQRTSTSESANNQDVTLEQNYTEPEVEAVAQDPYYGQINSGTTVRRSLFNKATGSAENSKLLRASVKNKIKFKHALKIWLLSLVGTHQFTKLKILIKRKGSFHESRNFWRPKMHKNSCLNALHQMEPPKFPPLKHV